MTHTQANIGVRRMIYSLAAPEHRNYEPKGGQLYKAVQDRLQYGGTVYRSGDTIPFDAGSQYSDDALMEVYFNAAMVDPI